MQRISSQIIKVGACAYDWRTHRPSKWHPDPVEDVEEFCRRLLDRVLDNFSMYLRPEEYDDSLMELIALAWRLERRFDPDKGQSFRAYATWIISQRAVDHGPRRVLGRHGTRTHNYMAPSENPYEGHSMGETVDGQSLDDQADRHSNLARILRERDSDISWKESELGFGPDGETTI